jgi:hypothetical protein
VCLETLEESLFADVVEGYTVADLMEGVSLFGNLQRDESDCKPRSLRDSSKVFVFLMESFGPAADQGIEAPKHVVDFLVEFEKNQLSAAAVAAVAEAAAAAGKATAAGNRFATKEKRTEDKEQSEHLSHESLTSTVEDFTSRDLVESVVGDVEFVVGADLITLIRQPEKPLNLYCAATVLLHSTGSEVSLWNTFSVFLCSLHLRLCL